MPSFGMIGLQAAIAKTRQLSDKVVKEQVRPVTKVCLLIERDAKRNAMKVISPRGKRTGDLARRISHRVKAIGLTGAEGEVGVLPGHRPLFVGIGRGKLTYRAGGDEESFPVRGGYAQVQPEKVVVMTEVGEDDDSGNSAA